MIKIPLFEKLTNSIKKHELLGLDGPEKEEGVLTDILPEIKRVKVAGFLLNPLFQIFAPQVARLIIKGVIYSFNSIFGKGWILKQ